MSIIKYYIDIGCVYEGEENIESAYTDHENWTVKKYGLIGILKLQIDIKRKTKEEIFFKQIFSPNVNKFSKNLIADLIYNKNNGNSGEDEDIIMLFREFTDADLLVTWNGRDFDIPIIVHNLKFSKEYSRHCIGRLYKKDRDLLDLSILKEINIKGGLQAVIKRLKINYGIKDKNILEYNKEELCFLTDFDKCTNVYNNNLKFIKQRNEFDVKVLPLLEEKLGYLYEPRLPLDKFHKNW